ncbi:MAG: hypothetical protein ACPG05_04105 [Bdellovibrionales bacterium]
MSLIVSSILVVSLSFFLGSSAVIEQDQFAIVYMASTIRLLFVFGLVLFVIFFIRRSFENKEIEYLLSRPIGRKSFVASYVVALMFLCCFFTLVATLINSLVGWSYIGEGYFLWSYSLFVELMIMAVAALFFAMVLSSPVSAALVSCAFYALSRLMGDLLGISSDVYAGTSFELMSNAIKVVSLFTPRFDLLTQSSWLLYGVEGAVGFVVVTIQGITFVAVLTGATMIDLVKRQF